MAMSAEIWFRYSAAPPVPTLSGYADERHYAHFVQ